MNAAVTVKSIGIIRTPFKTVDGVPVQPDGGAGVSAIIELNPEFVKGLGDLEGFSHIILLYHFHLVRESLLTVVPFLDNKPHGIFSTRSPARPNAIGISIVKLIKIEGNLIFIENVDMLDQTPLLDIKPFFPRYDNRPDATGGWLEGKTDLDISMILSDKRFK